MHNRKQRHEHYDLMVDNKAQQEKCMTAKPKEAWRNMKDITQNVLWYAVALILYELQTMLRHDCHKTNLAMIYTIWKRFSLHATSGAQPTKQSDSN